MSIQKYLSSEFNPSAESVLFDDFTGANSSGFGDTGWASSNYSTSLATSDTNHVGIVSVHTTTSATGLGWLSRVSNSVRFAGGLWVCEGLIQLQALSTALEEYAVRFGFFDTTSTGADAVDGAYIEYDRATNGDVWVLKTASNSVRTSTVLDGLAGRASAPVSAAVWAKLRVEVNAAASSVAFYIDGTLVGTHTTNIPTGAGRETGEGLSILKSVGTTQRALHVDYWYRKVTFSTAR